MEVNCSFKQLIFIIYVKLKKTILNFNAIQGFYSLYYIKYEEYE